MAFDTVESRGGSSSVAESASGAMEFELLDRDFERIRTLLKQRSGIDLGTGKKMLVYGRLQRRLRALRLTGFKAYVELIEDSSSEESTHFLNALTTNVTEFFREAHHFDFLANTVVPEALARGSRRLRIWSAGCSTGEEPYSIASTLAGSERLVGIDVRILATDIDIDVLQRAKAGIYPVDKVANLSAPRRRFFRRGIGRNSGSARASADIAEMVAFKQLNLLEPWPMKGPFDAIFCRNVVIYFDTTTRNRLVQRFASLIEPGGYLFMGHSEALTGGSSSEFEGCGKTIYRRLPGENA